ncbi:MAG: FtsX-like permease family protein, partial [Acidobacteriota bacterium]
AVDELFKNANPPTKTETEKAFILGFISMLGNLQFLVASVCTVVIFTIILVAANTMAMAIRERGREIAILKALGFSKRLVLTLLLSESVMLAMGGALAGSLGAALIFSVVNVQAITGGMFPPVNVTGSTILICAAIGALVGLVASGFPAWRASQVSVAEALRRVV